MSELQGFLKRLKGYSGWLTKQQQSTLRGQALKGDLEGAKRGLDTVLSRHNKPKRG